MKKKKLTKRGTKFYFCPEKRLWIQNTKKTLEEIRREYGVEIVENSSKKDSLRTDKLMML